MTVFFKKFIGRTKNALNKFQFLKPGNLKAKLKEILFDMIYKLYISIEEALLKKFYVEFEFYTQASTSLKEYNKKHKTKHMGDFKCTLPVIFMVKDQGEAEFLVAEFVDQLVKDYALKIIRVSPLEEISEISLKTRLDVIEAQLRGAKTGKIDFWTYTPIKGIEPLEYDNPRIEENVFRYSRSGPNSILQNWDFVIKYYKAISEE